MQEWFAKFTLYLGVKYTYLQNLGQVQANLECSFNVAGVVFKKKTDGEGLVLLWTFPVLRCDWGKNFSNQSIPNLSPFAVFAQIPPPPPLIFTSKKVLMISASTWLMRKLTYLTNPGGPNPSGILHKKHTNNSGRKSPLLNKTLGAVFGHFRSRAAFCDGLSKHTHAQRRT